MCYVYAFQHNWRVCGRNKTIRLSTSGIKNNISGITSVKSKTRRNHYRFMFLSDSNLVFYFICKHNKSNKNIQEPINANDILEDSYMACTYMVRNIQ